MGIDALIGSDALRDANRLDINGIGGRSMTGRSSTARIGTAKFVIVALSSDKQSILTVLRVGAQSDGEDSHFLRKVERRAAQFIRCRR